MTRVQRLQQRLAWEQLDAILITHPSNLRYLCNFSGTTGFLLVRRQPVDFFTDHRYIDQANVELTHIDVHLVTGDPLPLLARHLRSGKVKRLGCEADHLSFNQYKQLAQFFAPEITLVPCSGWVEQFRLLKDETEQAYLRQAAALTDQVFQASVERITPGMTERELALEIVYQCRQTGAERLAFPPMVTSGFRTALPHASPSAKPLETGDFVLIDLGCVVQGYAADMTRMVVLGTPSMWQTEVHQAVLDAQRWANTAICAGKPVKAVDTLIRQIMADAGYPDVGCPTVGHGIGLELHEAPDISVTGTGHLQQGMALALEPGVYLRGRGGVRIENTLLVQDQSVELLTQTPMELISI
ncbi:MAG: aminopeptidase P family protein [Gemmatimonadetes bacterium]|nr:MAG: aminopeptidase P family protein [Gemmatimonadota bacterium]